MQAKKYKYSKFKNQYSEKTETPSTIVKKKCNDFYTFCTKKIDNKKRYYNAKYTKI